MLISQQHINQILSLGPHIQDAVSPSLNLGACLDPTQRAVHDRVRRWAMDLTNGAAPNDLLRVVFLGTAGTGKSDTIKSIMRTVEKLFGAGSVLRCAHTGVAASNMGVGAETISSLFKLGSKAESTRAIDELVKSLGQVRLVIVDEISMVGAQQFYAMSERLETVARVLWRRAHKGRSRSSIDGTLTGEPSHFGGFGGRGVLLVGDFGQIPPIGEASLIAPSPGQHREAAAGQRLFRSFR